MCFWDQNRSNFLYTDPHCTLTPPLRSVRPDSGCFFFFVEGIFCYALQLIAAQLGHFSTSRNSHSNLHPKLLTSISHSPFLFFFLFFSFFSFLSSLICVSDFKGIGTFSDVRYIYHICAIFHIIYHPTPTVQVRGNDNRFSRLLFDFNKSGDVDRSLRLSLTSNHLVPTLSPLYPVFILLIII